MVGALLRLYINALLRGNPFVVAITAIVAVAVSVGPFYEGLSRREPGAMFLAGLVLVGIIILLAVAIVDRKLNAPKKRAQPAKGARTAGSRSSR
ncbi:hypothetical protein OJF2_42970 [Aquisphaera giovannonii]|uniref:Uncharacterized protein n=1 Tax=Aquisphaera giovannonii TaxID=406548 RepID=A0A5B9W733_9BACT|nr:hypothetical protein [Aquisphaera giovannonii]QEH35740.1 hypothetical protein OJF2_42970 [Aquisphaera giovannonii]